MFHKDILTLFNYRMRDDSLQKSSRLDELINNLDMYTEFLKPYKLLLKTAKTQFLVDSFWTNENIIETELKNDIDSFIEANTSEDIPLNLFKHYKEINNNQNKLNQTKLEKLFLEINQFKSIWNDVILTPADALTKSEFSERLSKNFEKLNVRQRFMKEKKVHEVDIMSKFVAELCEVQGIETVKYFDMILIS